MWLRRVRLVDMWVRAVRQRHLGKFRANVTLSHVRREGEEKKERETTSNSQEAKKREKPGNQNIWII